MAIAATTVWEIRTAGDDTNGGGYDPAAAGGSSVDYSQQDTKNTVGSNISTTDVVANNTTTLTSATAAFTSALQGNIIHLSGGTGSLAVTRRRVTSVTNATTIVVDAAVATGTGIAMNIGGACATLGGSSVNAVNGNTHWIKSGSYTQTVTSANVINGGFSRASYVIGYGTVRDDFGAKPIITASGISSFTMININGAGYCRHIQVDGASLAASAGFICAAGGKIGDCDAFNCAGIAFNGNTGVVINCVSEGHSTNTAFTGAGKYYGCIARNGTSSGFRDGIFINCIADSNSGASTDGFLMNSNAMLAINCVAYNNGRHGFNCSTGTIPTLINCIAEDNGASGTGTGFINVSNGNGSIWANCAAFSNATADFTIGTGINNYNSNPITGSSSFFTNAASGDFSLNNTAGGGADLRNTGYPTSWGDGDTPTFPDIGVSQHDDAGGGGGEHSAVF